MLWTLLTGKVREFVARSKVPAEEASLVQHAEVFFWGWFSRTRKVVDTCSCGAGAAAAMALLPQDTVFTNDHRCRM